MVQGHVVATSQVRRSFSVALTRYVASMPHESISSLDTAAAQPSAAYTQTPLTRSRHVLKNVAERDQTVCERGSNFIMSAYS